MQTKKREGRQAFAGGSGSVDFPRGRPRRRAAEKGGNGAKDGGQKHDDVAAIADDRAQNANQHERPLQRGRRHDAPLPAGNQPVNAIGNQGTGGETASVLSPGDALSAISPQRSGSRSRTNVAKIMSLALARRKECRQVPKGPHRLTCSAELFFFRIGAGKRRPGCVLLS